MSEQIKRIRMTLLLVLLLIAGGISAQTVKVTVKDSNGEPVIGASVIEKGTRNGGVTDFDGNISVKMQGKHSLVISYIGMKTKTVDPKGKTALNVTLEDDAATLNDVVVIGYGTVRKKDLTGSVTSVSAKQLENIPVTNVTEALTGKMAGVNITTTEGSPDAEVKIRVRGGGSLSQDNSPLYIVDGFPVSSISDVSPSDIQSIDVLKDASSTAIYGAKGANGVVIITTKSGKEGKVQVNLNAQYGFRKSVGEVKMLNPYEYAYWQYELSPGSSAYGSFDDLDIYRSMAGTNYQDELFGRTGTTSQVSLNVSGGSKETKWSASYSRSDDKAIMIGSGFSRDNFNIKLQTKLNKWLTLDVNDRFSYTKIDGLKGGADTQESSKAYSIAARAIVDRPVDVLQSDVMEEESGDNFTSTVRRVNATYKLQTRLQNNINASMTWEPFKGLRFKTEFGYGWRYNNMDQVWGLDNSGNSKFGHSGRPFAYLEKRVQKEWRWANTVNWDKKGIFHKEDHFNVLVGHEMSSSYYHDTNMTSVDFDRSSTTDQILAAMANGTALPTTTYISLKDNMLSYFGRINYTLLDRYLMTFTMRADGSSRFTDGNRWGVFPSVALAWRITEEPWMKGTDKVLSNLKARLSFGTAGNNRVNAKYMYTTYAVG
ncbi:MAG: SusC/RagA family TonB-linked outer membrane protein, partial [Prevotella sp.]|nr:SusC/RagA family TonB-linked outer membrane protein [Prevotella sp.]